MKFIYLIFILSFGVVAEDEFNDEFNESFTEVTSTEVLKKELYGAISFEAVHNYNSSSKLKNLSSTKVLLDLIYDSNIEDKKIYLNLQGYYDAIYSSNLGNYLTTPKGYKNELSLNEAHISGSINSNLDYKIGRQIVVWGKSDNIRITDILNPTDSRVPGLVDIKNLRLGRLMSKFDYYHNNINFSAILLHENLVSKNPKYGSDFKQSIDIKENTPDDSLKNTGIALSFSTSIGSVDFAGYFANTYLDKSYLKDGELHFDDKVNMVGFAINKVLGSYLLKTEFAYFDAIKYNNLVEQKSQSNFLLGVEYSGINDGSLSYELAYKKINSFDAIINTQINKFTPKETYQQAIRLSKSYINQTINTTILVNLFGKNADEGGFLRASVDYAIDDKTSVDFGVIDYIGGSAVFDAIKDNDRIFAKLTYSF